MATYLRGFVDSVSDLPAELQRIFGLMRELDTQAAALQRKVDSSAQAALDSKVNTSFYPLQLAAAHLTQGSSAAAVHLAGRRGAPCKESQKRWTQERCGFALDR